jgi:hypothetical protein
MTFTPQLGGTGHRLEESTMTQLMEQAIAKASRLTEEEQNAIASIILRELESEERWDGLFGHPKSADLLSRLADEAMSDVQSGRVRKLELDDL